MINQYINCYSRPETLEEALALLAQPGAIPLGGGTFINAPDFATSYSGDLSLSVVDLQAVGLDQIQKKGDILEIGATATLQQLFESEYIPIDLRDAAHLEAAINLRNMATVAGTLVACDGRSAFATTMFALDAQLTIAHHSLPTKQLSFGNFIPLRELAGQLITQVNIPLNIGLAFEYVARTPADLPIICVALAQWPSGRTRLTLGGYGQCPLLAMDAKDINGIETAARNAFHDAGDEWASAEYRLDVAAALVRRCLEKLTVESIS